MEIFYTKTALRQHLGSLKKSDMEMSIGFVPTMGYLHPGHLSLMDRARNDNDFVVASLFVNPSQFGENEDFSQYPRNIKRDIELCTQNGVDVLFIPDSSEMYLPDHLTYVTVRELSDVLCGHHRPGHFDGVVTIVAKLFNIIQPNKAYLGQKDGQQALILRRFTRDLDFDIEIIICPTVRESNGLAMSSRNKYLSSDGRDRASIIFQALSVAADQVYQGVTDVNRILEGVTKAFASVPEISCQYIECRDCDNLQPVETLEKPALLAVAVFLESVRLIDNIILERPGGNSNETV
jgi:pantoate--beta-alanine ligase